MNDLINRQDAIDALQKEINKGIPPFDDVMGSIRCGVRLARNIIEDLPSAQPERKTGRWRMQVNPKRECYGHWECNQCGVASWEQTNFCSNCGAKMEVEHE